MSDVSVLLDAIQSGAPVVPAQLLPLLCKELRQLATLRLVHEAPGQTLQCNRLAICVQPDEGIHLNFQTKVPDVEGNRLQPRDLASWFVRQQSLSGQVSPYGGYGAMASNTNGSFNTAEGLWALIAVG